MEIGTLIDWPRFRATRAALGANFWRTLIFLRDEGGRSVAAIEAAVRAHDAASIVGPAELLKTEALHLGAIGVGEIAELVEMEARDCLETHDAPDALIEAVVALRRAFGDTVALLEQDISPLMHRDAATRSVFAS